MPRVLVVSYFFPPHGGGGVQRVLGWTRWLPENGWDVTVLAAGPDGFWIHDPSLLERVPAGTEVLRVDAPTAVALWRRHVARDAGPAGPAGPAAPRRSARDDALRALARATLLPDSYRAWAGPAVRAGLGRLARGGIDAVLSTSPPETAHLVGARLARGAPGGRLPWVADFRDPWVALHYRKPPSPLHAWLHRRMERRVLEQADRVLCASRTHEQAVREALGARAGARVAFLPNGVELDSGPPEVAAPAAAAPPAAGEGRLRVVLTGTLVEVPALETFLGALARRLEREPAWRGRLEVVLAGPHEERHRAWAADPRLAGVVRLPGPVSNAEARRLQREASVLLLVRNEGAGYAAMVPGKLYEYLAARRPLVAMVGESEAARLARDCGARLVDPADGDGAVGAVFEAAQGRGARPDAAAIDALLATRSRRALARELASILGGLKPPASARQP
jgi:glycosyltransferase involved in cell wall biosynthesis